MKNFQFACLTLAFLITLVLNLRIFMLGPRPAQPEKRGVIFQEDPTHVELFSTNNTLQMRKYLRWRAGVERGLSSYPSLLEPFNVCDKEGEFYDFPREVRVLDELQRRLGDVKANP